MQGSAGSPFHFRMDFDLSQIPVPFRMQPGLRRLTTGSSQLTRLEPDSVLYREKRKVLDAGQSRHCVRGFDPSAALEAIAEKASADPGRHTALASPLELAVEEDLVILDGTTTTLPWLCVCVPSHWAPEDKLGLPFAAVHAPVADNGALQAAGGHLVELVTGDDCWERFVWTVTPSPRHDQHPRRHARAAWPHTHDVELFAAACYLRAERQTFFPVGRGTRQAVFTIRVMLQPLIDAVAAREHARRLHDSLASMTGPVLEYKGLTTAREPLLQWLRQHSG